MGNNLNSPISISVGCQLDSLLDWYEAEIALAPSEAIRSIMTIVGRHPEEFFRWPNGALLLWHGCDRVAPRNADGKKQVKYHRYPDIIKSLAKGGSVELDARSNGPAIAAFQMAGGERPGRSGSTNAWSVHHIYSGKFPFPGQIATTHAKTNCAHFTQSAGLLAVHPIADALCDDAPAVTWFLRAKAFQLFGYDPDGVFSLSQDEFGFTPGSRCEVVFCEI